MNTKTLIAFAAFAFAGTGAMAQEAAVDTTPFHATRTRAEVRAEVLQARAAGVQQFSTEFDSYVRPMLAAAPSALTREEVRAELRKTPRQSREGSFSAG